MKVLVLNTGSSSVKFRVFECDNGDTKDLAQGIIERIGAGGAQVKQKAGSPLAAAFEAVKPEFSRADGEWNIPDHRAAIRVMYAALSSDKCQVVKDLNEIKGIGHRVVHGGESFSDSILITDEVVAGIREVSRLAPLHNPPALQGIEACAEAFVGVPQVAVFDTAFHATIPPKAFRYPLPKYLYTEYGIRRYGFHGTSHRFVSAAAIKMLDKPAAETKVITCHLGNGSSIAAVMGGKCVDTSMGLTPLEGVMMGTRSGSVDPYIPLFLQKELGMSVDEVDKLMNKESGCLGITGLSDMRDIEERAFRPDPDPDCKLALEMFSYRVAEYIGRYAMAMNGCDAIVFTAGIGENGPEMREMILENAGYLGCHLDVERNNRNDTVISTDDSTTKALRIATNEELVIALDTAKVVGAR